MLSLDELRSALEKRDAQAVLTHFTGYIRKLVGLAVKCYWWVEYDDLHQEAMLAAWKAVDRFDLEQNPTNYFIRYMRSQVRWRLRLYAIPNKHKVVRKLVGQVGPAVQTLWLDAAEIDGPQIADSWRRRNLDRLSTAPVGADFDTGLKDLRVALKRVKPQAAAILVARHCGATQDEVAATLGLTRQAVQQSEARNLKKLRRLYQGGCHCG